MPRRPSLRDATPAPAADGMALADALGDGPARDALREALAQQAIADAYHGRARAIVRCEALTGVAQALAGLHAYGPAEQHLALALDCAAALGGCDLVADLRLAWAEVATNAADLADARGQRQACAEARRRARGHATAAARLARRVSDPNWELRLVLRASDVLERCGNHDDAMQLQQHALALMGMAGPEAAPADHGFDAVLPAGTVTQPAPGGLM